MARRILVVEDEAPIREMVCFVLEQNGFQPVEAEDYDSAVNQLNEPWPDLILLDWMLPGGSGLQFIKHLKREALTRDIPVMMLTARGEEEDRVRGLETGADDYITKPFNPVEVLARVRSQLRRYLQLGGGTVRPTSFVIGGIELDDNAKAVTVDGEPVSLTPKEYDILRFLMQNAGTVFTPAEIYRRVWDDIPLNAAGAIAVHIRHLREKLEINPAEPRYIKVVWGKGYKMEVNPI